MATIPRVGIVVASYNEGSNIANVIQPILENTGSEVVIVIADDSSDGFRHQMIARIQERFSSDLENRVLFSFGDTKTGRGTAVRRGFSALVDNFPNLSYIIEMDGDGSHRSQDVLHLVGLKSNEDLIVGSRYLGDSQIMGWTWNRRALSRVLNWLLPRLLGLSLKDVTNGLRRYSRVAIKVILSAEPKTTGFIYLSECALLLQREGLAVHEVPIVFQERISGTSSVGIRELADALLGVFQIVKLRLGK